jgi:hypothetical protein
MNVGQLKALLANLDDNTEIMREVPSGDYWRTILAKPITEVGEARVEHTDYHNCDKIVDQDDSDDNDPCTRTVLIIS